LIKILFDIHNDIKFNNKNQLKKNFPKQLIVLKYLKPNDVVLEFGGSIGRNSCIISKILSDSKNLLTIEPNPTEPIKLTKNCYLNNFNFQIEPIVLSVIPLYLHP
jgi:predicted O-methyltransferase YrrM